MTNSSEISANPFSVKTPENLAAEELVDLFVPYPEFQNLQVSGHQFLHGHRGSGKSMMLRMMSPDSQMLARKCNLNKLPYFGVYLSIKATELNAPEYARLEEQPSGTILSEHVLVTKLISSLFISIRQSLLSDTSHSEKTSALINVVENVFFGKLRYSGCEFELPESGSECLRTIESTLSFAINLIDNLQAESSQYIKRISFTGSAAPYQGALLGFQDVLLPLTRAFSKSGVIPDAPVYFLLDDADNLTEQQTKILNTWVSYRSTDVISLKISTQLNYKTYKTTSGVLIQAPHDFSSINFTSVHTGSIKERYPELVADIVRKRLSRYGAENTDPYLFFPEDEGQRSGIKEIADEYKEKWANGESGSYRASDDAYRYARPEYIRRMSGPAKQGARYRYAGFEQLVHVSSGIIRFFLEPAARMFTEQLQINNGNVVTEISASVQDQELRKQADQLYLQNFEDIAREADESSSQGHPREIHRLRNIVLGIASLFRAHIMDESATQRRVFSFSVSNNISDDMKELLRLGVIHGYFYMDSIGAKNGFGRVPLYVLTRRIAPAFLLDPIGFSGYLTVTDDFLNSISKDPGTFIARLRKNGLSESLYNQAQMSLLDDAEK